MTQFIIRRFLITIPTLLVLSVIVFSMIHLIPGDPVRALLRHSGGISTAGDPDILRHQLGLDKPLYEQYWVFLAKLCHGDLGTSIFMQCSVINVIRGQLPYTLRLAGLATLFVVVLGVLAGILAAVNVNTWVDTVVMALAILGISVPGFWLGVMLILVFCVKLAWLPIFGPESLKILILPAFVLSVQSIALIARVTRSELLSVLGNEYIVVARSKGVSEKTIIVKHALRNALIPVVTILGLGFGGMFVGAVVIENVFGRQGMGNAILSSIMLRDYPLTQGIVLIVGVGYIVLNLVVDLLYSVIDPRIRYT